MSIVDNVVDHALNRAQWAQHQAVSVSARAAGACWRCAAEAGLRATDTAESEPSKYEMHPECVRRIERGV
jgi:hypothetical protein